MIASFERARFNLFQKTIFQGLSQEALEACVHSLVQASNAIRSNTKANSNEKKVLAKHKTYYAQHKSHCAIVFDSLYNLVKLLKSSNCKTENVLKATSKSNGGLDVYFWFEILLNFSLEHITATVRFILEVKEDLPCEFQLYKKSSNKKNKKQTNSRKPWQKFVGFT